MSSGVDCQCADIIIASYVSDISGLILTQNNKWLWTIKSIAQLFKKRLRCLILSRIQDILGTIFQTHTKAFICNMLQRV